VFYNLVRFAQGGRHVAEALGADLVASSTSDPVERRAQNIVQEIALASNMPVPPLYVLNEERGINAFAAGMSPADAVVAVTRGAMEHLSRDELQGVIGHEFSHILNGDMRLSLRLAAMLRGITFIGDVGAILLRSTTRRRYRSSNSKNDGRAALLMLGLGLYLLGLIGGLMAGLIKSAISKQKEYLADASSVQFTRNPDGIGDALKVIGGYTPGMLVESARAEELSHLFFGQVKHALWLMFATHPKLEDRIRRVDPDWDGQFIERKIAAYAEHTIEDESGEQQSNRALAAAGLVAATALPLSSDGSSLDPTPPTGYEGALDPIAASNGLAGAVIEEARDPLGAMGLLLALLWHPDGSGNQLDFVHNAEIKGLEDIVRQRSGEMATISSEHRLALIELCLPALQTLSPAQYDRFKTLLLQFIRADGRIDLGEWCLFQLVRHYLDPHFLNVRPSRPKYSKLSRVKEELETALGTLALLGTEPPKDAVARGAAILELNLTMKPADELGVTEFSKAVHELAQCYPLIKVTILKAMAAVAGHDGHISGRELTLIKAIAAVIDCPVPTSALPVGVSTP
jgi:Zn-dependent protease with chaperone function